MRLYQLSANRVTVSTVAPTPPKIVYGIRRRAMRLGVEGVHAAHADEAASTASSPDHAITPVSELRGRPRSRYCGIGDCEHVHDRSGTDGWRRNDSTQDGGGKEWQKTHILYIRFECHVQSHTVQ